VARLLYKYGNRDLVVHVSRVSSAHGLRLPTELTMFAKTLLNLDEVGRRRAPDFDVQRSIRNNATSLMQERLQRSLSGPARSAPCSS
jgi:hypothetical protein